MATETERTERIRINFSDAVSYYDEHATVQMEIARRLYKALEPWKLSVPEGPIIEIGAGTGFFTRYLLDMYRGRDLIISDLSEDMVQYCREKFGLVDSAEYKILDAEQDSWPESRYALITGNFVVQWFKHPAKTVSKMAASLKPGGLMLISFPASESFPTWRKYCLELGLPFTGNPLPDLEQIVIDLSTGPVKVDFFEDDVTDTFETVFDFFRHLKLTGTSTAMMNKNLSAKQLHLLNDYWLEQGGGEITVEYHAAFIAVKRDLES